MVVEGKKGRCREREIEGNERERERERCNQRVVVRLSWRMERALEVG